MPINDYTLRLYTHHLTRQVCLERMKRGGLEPLERLDCFAEFQSTHPDAQAVKEFYNLWAPNYTADVEVAKRTPVDVATELEALFPDDETKAKLRILDVGAGTGVGGRLLAERGFYNIDATDASPGMLEEAKKLEVYQNYFPEVLVKGHKMTSVAPETYDVITSSGSFYPFQLQGYHLLCFLDCVKTGGYLVLSSCLDEEVGLHPVLHHLQEDGMIQILNETYLPKWYRENDGMLYVLKKLKPFED